MGRVINVIVPVGVGGVVRRSGVMLRLFSLPYDAFDIRLTGDASAMLESRGMGLDALAPFRLLVKVIHDNVKALNGPVHAFFWYFKPRGMGLILETDQSPSQYFTNYLNINPGLTFVKSLYGKSIVVTWSMWARQGLLMDGFRDEDVKVVPLPYVPAVMRISGVNKDKAVIFAGYDYARKGGDVAIKVFKVIKSYDPGVKVIYVGKLPFPKVPGYIDVYHPHLPRGALLRLIAKSMVMIAPSRHEAFSITAMEAMANETVVVSSDREGIGELVKLNGGITCDLNDIQCFVENTLRNLNRRSHDLTAARQLERLKSNHNIDLVSGAMKSVYEEVIRR